MKPFKLDRFPIIPNVLVLLFNFELSLYYSRIIPVLHTDYDVMSPDACDVCKVLGTRATVFAPSVWNFEA